MNTDSRYSITDIVTVAFIVILHQHQIKDTKLRLFLIGTNLRQGTWGTKKGVPRGAHEI